MEKEFRLGNYVNCTYVNDTLDDDVNEIDEQITIIGKVVSLDNTGDAPYPIMVETEKANEEDYNIDGIPITEEWLLRFVFETDKITFKKSGISIGWFANDVFMYLPTNQIHIPGI